MLNTLSFLLEEAGIFIKDIQKTKLIAYTKMLNKWNKVHNFTSIRNLNKMLVYHILDSIVVALYMQGHTFIDVGTGPGLPGIPLSIVLPHKHFTLLDSFGKRVRFVRQVQYELFLENINSIHSRLETFLPKTPFDGVISRAFASLHNMTNWCRKLIDRNGHFYALKGRLLHDEIIKLSKEFIVESIIKLHVPNLNADRHLIIIKMN